MFIVMLGCRQILFSFFVVLPIASLYAIFRRNGAGIFGLIIWAANMFGGPQPLFGFYADIFSLGFYFSPILK
jgi:hypothetical protein